MQIADEVGTSKIIFDKMYFVLRSLASFIVGQRFYDKRILDLFY